MGLKEQLMADYKEAMKNADAVKKETVNMVRAAVKQYEVDQRVTLEDDADIVKIIKKQVKMRTDALADFAKAGRDDMVEGYEKEIEILIGLGNGPYSATAWGCDLTYDYVKINGDYRT